MFMFSFDELIFSSRLSIFFSRLSINHSINLPIYNGNGYGLVSLFSDISTFVGNLMPKS